jgi:putative oxidoreductase
MTASLQNPLSLIGRVLIAALFIPAGFGKIAGFAGTAQYIASKGLPASEVLAMLAIVAELGGGLALLVGLFTRWAALALAGFTLVAGIIFHNYWALPADQQMIQQLMFMKNIAITGGLLALAAFGAGAWSIDAKRAAA